MSAVPYAALQLLRWIWALPATAVGLAAAGCALCFGARPRIVEGVVEIGGGRLARWTRALPSVLRFEAITLGHIVIGCSDTALARLRDHERVHVRQYERWGLFFFPAYLGSSLWQLLRGRHPYFDNRFEVEAFRTAAAAPARPRCEHHGVTREHAHTNAHAYSSASDLAQ